AAALPARGRGWVFNLPRQPQVQRAGVDVAHPGAEGQRAGHLCLEARRRLALLACLVEGPEDVVEVAAAQPGVGLPRHLAEGDVIADAGQLLTGQVAAVRWAVLRALAPTGPSP